MDDAERVGARSGGRFLKKTTLRGIAFGLAAGLMASGAFGYWYWIQTPKYSLGQIRKAFATHDVSKFEEYVDVESVLSRLIDALMKYTMPIPPGETGDSSAALKTQMHDVARERVLRLIEEGFPDSSASESESEDAELRTILQKAGVDEDGFLRVTYIKKQGKIALAGLGFRNTKRDADETIELKMRDVGQHWQVIELTNVIELLDAESK